MGASVPGENKVVQNVGSGIRGPRSVFRPAIPRVYGFQQVPQTLALGFLICRTEQPWYPAPRLMTVMTQMKQQITGVLASPLLSPSLEGNIQWNMLGDRLVYHCGLFFFFFFNFFSFFKPLRLCADFETWGAPWHSCHCLPWCLFSLYL